MFGGQSPYRRIMNRRAAALRAKVEHDRRAVFIEVDKNIAGVCQHKICEEPKMIVGKPERSRPVQQTGVRQH